MDWINSHLLSILIFLPSVGALLVLLAKTRHAIRWAAMGATLATFAMSLLLFFGFNWHAKLSTPKPSGDARQAIEFEAQNHAITDSAADAKGVYGYHRDADFGVVQMVERADWIKAFNIQYLVGIDGLSFPLVILSTFVCVLACIASWNIEKMTKGYFALFLFLETGILGVFLSLDFFLFYVFFEVSLLPMYFLIGIWGGPRKEYAAIKFFLYTLVGSIGLLIVLIGAYLYSRDVFPATTANPVAGTFDLLKLAGPEMRAKFAFGTALFGVGKTFFVLLMIGFLIKVPAVPVHTWLPDAHVEAPTPISMILAAILLKMGGYGIFRIAYPLFPDAAKHLWMLVAVIGVVSIIYGAFCAMSQTDFKKLVAYSSVSHMGFVTLGAAMMTRASVNGALFMMIAHGVTSAMMFFVVGVIYERAHHRELGRFGGIANTMPVYTGFSTVACFANLGLPGLCGFVGEVMVLLGCFQAARPTEILRTAGAATPEQIYPLAIIACFGVILTAGYMLWTIQRVFFGPEKAEYKGFPEVDRREVLVLTPLTIMAILLGVLPTVFFFVFTEQTVSGLFRIFG